MTDKRNNRRDFLKASGVAIGGALMAACAPSSSETSSVPAPGASGITASKTDIQFLNELIGSKEDGRTYLLAAFNAANDQINVSHEGFGGADVVDQKFLTALAGGLVPDLFHNEANYIPGYAEMDALTDLGPYLDASTRINKSDIDPIPLDLCTYNGKIYGIPIWQETTMLYYNKDVMKAAGLDPESPPRDWDSLREAAAKIVKRDSTGKLEVAGLVQSDWTIIRTFQAALYSWGGSLLSPDGTKAAFNSQEGKDALQTLVDMIVKDELGDFMWGAELEGTPDEPFIVGKQGFAFDVAAAAKRFAKNAPNFVNWGVVSLP
ncbi:MAG TPA: substrate-binding domain-containing protein, partial [Anaerolineales bacterium]|nr:substrate-binding domain-containing protein [Anaerolineales bacterium]